MRGITLILIAVTGIGAAMLSSCKKSTPQSTITYENDTYTPISIVVNGVGKTIASGGSVLYVANVGTTAGVTAHTSGAFGGATITWSFTDYFPGKGGDNLNEPLYIGVSYFYLEAVNSYTSPVSSLIVNQGLTSQTGEMMNIPNDGNAYGIGYYLTFSNTVIEAIFRDSTTLTIRNLGLLNIPSRPDTTYTADF